jgi:hypothetical protein
VLFVGFHEMQRICETAEKASHPGKLEVECILILISKLDLERDSDDLFFATTSKFEMGE